MNAAAPSQTRLALRRPRRPCVVPSLYAADHAGLRAAALACVAAGAERLHFDVMDGHFTPRLGLTPEALAGLTATPSMVPIDAHLMVERPEALVEDVLSARASSVCLHIENGADAVEDCLAAVRRAGRPIGLSLRPGTPAGGLDRYTDRIDFVLVMLVEPGHPGARSQPGMLARIADLRGRLPDLLIACDGGIDTGSAAAAVAAGADWIVAGNAVFGPGVPAGLSRLADAITITQRS